MTLKVLTLNLWHDAGPWPERATLIRDWLERLDPDLIALQEVLRGESFDQLAELFTGKPHQLDFVKAIPFWRRPELAFGNAIASRWPIVAREELRLPDRGDFERRAALTVRVDAPQGEVCFTCTHLNWKPDHGDTREQQLAAVYAQIVRMASKQGFPAILAGDLNAEPDSDEVRYLCGLHSLSGQRAYMVDAWRAAVPEASGYTWSNTNAYARPNLEPDRRIDYIFVRPPRDDGLGHVQSCRLVCDEEEDGVWPSDHFGVYAELRSEPVPADERPAWL